MSTEQNKALIQQFFEDIFNRGNLDKADQIVAMNYVNHDPAPGETPGLEGLKQFVTMLRTAFPDVHFTIDDLVAEGDKVVSRWSVRGTHQSEFIGIPATGRSITVTAINIHRVVDRKIQEGWLNWDALGMLQQLGVVPPPS